MDKSTTDSIILTIIHQQNQADQPAGIRALVAITGFADKTITKSIHRLEESGRLTVLRGERWERHQYVILVPPSSKEEIMTRLHLATRKINY